MTKYFTLLYDTIKSKLFENNEEQKLKLLDKSMSQGYNNLHNFINDEKN